MNYVKMAPRRVERFSCSASHRSELLAGDVFVESRNMSRLSSCELPDQRLL